MRNLREYCHFRARYKETTVDLKGSQHLTHQTFLHLFISSTMFSLKSTIYSAIVATALVLAATTDNVQALPQGGATGGEGEVATPAATTQAKSICKFMQQQDWRLINNNDSGKLSQVKGGFWQATDSKGQAKWVVNKGSNGSLNFIASKDLKGPLNVISIVFQRKTGNWQESYNFYINAGQYCSNEMTEEFKAEVNAGSTIVEVNHYQRDLVRRADPPLQPGN
jgi:hypothetical protein